jgi:hypothetical protein
MASGKKPPSKGAKQAATGGIAIDAVQVATPCKIKLQTLDDVRVEMSRVYRECRAGKLDITEGGKLSYQLQGIGKMIEASVIEKRLTMLENGLVESQTETVQDVDYVEID